MSNNIIKTLDYKGKYIIFEDDVEEVYMNLVRTLIYKGTLTYVPDACEHCGAVNEAYTIVKNGKRKTMVKLLSNQGTPCFFRTT
ncbi:hypothetical protein [Staphylococcus simiae]|uniref:Transposase for ISSha1 n=1 Tax=Staphylococcus simiae CCM 7213 = CCUG 51256 TaxID=911238 RepID=G5JJ79_9STAP|nr:hypothetical protein [Staphylococcus simiae]EHJ07767.1 transposase for ISSha1 [Staphylococcus simiae CCM 7213 = CCUG 51256]PNZ09541.1 hypothetical protein CD113_11620 [Staphylococcus simiae]SNV58369.1 transposase for ISSha1 [Staphylococcus simiae]